MAYLLRALILLMMLSLIGVTLEAMGLIPVTLGHIQLAIAAFLTCIFIQAFVMFYFIGVSRLVRNIWAVLQEGQGPGMEELFSSPPQDLSPFIKKTKKCLAEATRCQRQTIPWTMLMLTLGTLAFLFGAAHDTGVAEKATHVGLVYGFLAAATIGFFRQWHYLGKAHSLLRKIKGLYRLPDGRM
ncbi:MAG: hypothetical protein OXB88_04990 [Bacteriovoracales bacterium]|nr:hypothetical protein [Bacteriovoracales bacterium]